MKSDKMNLKRVLAHVPTETHHISLCLVLIILYLFISLINCECCSVTWCFRPLCLRVELPEKSLLKSSPASFSAMSERTPWWVASLIGPGEVEAALPSFTFSLKGAWVEALIYHVG